MGNLESLIFYCVSFFLSYIFYYMYNKNNKKIFLIISFIIPLIVGGFRYNVGTDFKEYYYMYTYNGYADFGFKIISSIAHFLGDFQFLLIIYCFLSLFFVFKALNNIEKKDRSFAYFLYLFLFFAATFNGVRQMLAVSIVFYSYKYIQEKKLVKFLIFIVLATLCHSTAFLFLPFYFILNENNMVKILLSFALIIISLYYDKIILLISKIDLFSKYAIYSNYTHELTNNYSFYLMLIILIYFLIFKKQLLKKDKYNINYIYLYSYSVILMLIGFYNPYVKRIASYFNISSLYLFPAVASTFNKPKNILLHKILIACYAVVKFILTFYVLGQSDIIPYSFFWNN